MQTVWIGIGHDPALSLPMYLLVTEVHTEDTFKNVHDSIFIVTKAWKEHTCSPRLDGQIVYAYRGLCIDVKE